MLIVWKLLFMGSDILLLFTKSFLEKLYSYFLLNRYYSDFEPVSSHVFWIYDEL